MSLAQKQELLRLVVKYSQAQQAILSKVATFNPEPQIIERSRQFPDFPETKLTRLIQWRGLQKPDAFETNPLHSLTNELVIYPLATLLENIYLENLSQYLKTGHPRIDDNLLAFKIEGIVWFIRLWTDRWGYAPPYAPKRLSSGLKIVLNSDELIASFQAVSKELWYHYEINPTKVVPLTTENFATVLDFHTNQARQLLTLRK